MGNLKSITKEEYAKLNKSQFEGFYVTINCKYIQSWAQFAEALGNAFQFPIRDEGFDGTFDWMTDFSWSEIVNQKTITMAFYESKGLCKANLKLKIQIFDFLDSIIDHWKDVSNLGYINGKLGETKDIIVYLID